MKTKILTTVLLLMIALGLTACSRGETGSTRPLTRVVTGITLSLDGEAHSYTSSDSLQAILTYLRHLDPRGRPAEDPSAADGNLWEITVTYSDGSRQEFMQKDDRYFLDADGQWKNIDETKALDLSKLFHLLPSEVT